MLKFVNSNASTLSNLLPQKFVDVENGNQKTIPA